MELERIFGQLRHWIGCKYTNNIGFKELLRRVHIRNVSAIRDLRALSRFQHMNISEQIWIPELIGNIKYNPWGMCCVAEVLNANMLAN